ncbi:MAG: hypothetical protein ACAH80_03970 [Alphaproteobacteria bacterium]
MTRTTQEQETIDKLLFEAVQKYDLTRMQAYVGVGANIHQLVHTEERVVMNGRTNTSSGMSPLYHYMLANYYRENISDYMLGLGVDVDVKNHRGNTPLMLSVKSGDCDRVQYYLKKGASPLSTNHQAEMVLEEARKLESSYHGKRQQIIDALVVAMATPKQAFAAAATPADKTLSETKDDITVMKPLSVGPKKPGGGGLNL